MAFEAERAAAASGARETTAALHVWLVVERGRVLLGWTGMAAGICALLLLSALGVSLITPETNTRLLPVAATGGDGTSFAFVAVRNFIVLLLHLMVCFATYLARRVVPPSEHVRARVDQWVHEHASGAAVAFVIGCTVFSLTLQAWALGGDMRNAASTLDLSPGGLVLRLLIHGIPELTAIFLPLAACILTVRRDVNSLAAASILCCAVCVPVLLGAAALEVWVTPVLGFGR